MLQKFALVTGASSGIGAEIAKKFSEMGYFVGLAGRDQMRLNEVSKKLSGKSQNFTFDLSSKERTDEFAISVLKFLEEHQLQLKALVNNAGIFERKSFEDSPLSLWEHQFRVNLYAPIQLTHALKDVIKKDQTSIVNISSTLGLRPVAMTSAYSASKAALNNWTQTLSLEWAEFGVRANAICPGLVDTPIHDFHFEKEDSETRKGRPRLCVPRHCV